MKIKDMVIKWWYLPGTPRGTICKIEKPNSFNLGFAICGLKDAFKKDTGRRISLARAMKNAGLSKEERTLIWEEYRNMSPNKRW